MHRFVWTALVAAGALTVASVAGVATAQSPAPPASPAPQRTLTVNGGGASEVASDAAVADRRAAYRTALGAALDDAKEKAAFVAGRSGLVLGAVQAVTEQTGSVLDGCMALGVAQGTAEARPLPQARRPVRKRRSGRKAQAPVEPPPAPYRCQVVASVAVSYAVAG